MANISNLKLKLVSQNMNSLSLSQGLNFKFNQKIVYLLKTRAKIIFLQDIRLNLEKNYAVLDQIKKYVQFSMYGSYSFFQNSWKSKRGVGLLFRNDLKFKIIETAKIINDNVLVLIIKLKETILILVSVYGPNERDISFYSELFECISNKKRLYPMSHVIMAGDWNCVDSLDKLDANIDLLNYKSVPNVANSKIINEHIVKLDLCDIFRILGPNRREYTYSHWSESNKSESRLDRFYLSDSLLECNIVPKIEKDKPKGVFDHSMIKLELGVGQTNKTYQIT